MFLADVPSDQFRLLTDEAAGISALIVLFTRYNNHMSVLQKMHRQDKPHVTCKNIVPKVDIKS